MKSVKLVLVSAMACFLFSGFASAAVVLTDQQIADITTMAEAGGDVVQAAEDTLAAVASDLIAQGPTGGELQAQIAVAIQETTSGLGTAAIPDLNTVIAGIVKGATRGAIAGVNTAVGSDPNLDAAALTAAVTKGAASAVAAIVQQYPGVDVAALVAAVNEAAAEMGGAPVDAEAFEAAGDEEEVLTIEEDPLNDLEPPSPT